MEGLFENDKKQDILFQEKPKKDKKKILRIMLVVLLIIIILSGSAYGIFYYISEVKNRDARTDIIEIASKIDLNSYTDLEGLSEYFDNINNNSYEFNAGFEANSHDMNNALKDMTNNEDINIKEFKLAFNGKVDKKANKLQTKVDLKYKDSSVINFEIIDDDKNILLYGDSFFQEHIGIEKSKMKNFLSKVYGLENDVSNQVDSVSNTSLNTNYIKEFNGILNSIIKSLPKSLSSLTDENFELQRNIKVNYRNNSLNAEAYTIKLEKNEYINLIENLKTSSKIEANNLSIELQSLVGRTDGLVDGVLNYFTQIISLREDEKLNINLYKIKNHIAKVEFIKIDENQNEEVVFEIEFINDKNSNEILISNDEFRLRVTITKDNSKIYTKIDIDGKIPIPFDLDFEDSQVVELEDDKIDSTNETENSNENNNDDNTEGAKLDQTQGIQNVFASDANEPRAMTDELDGDTPVSSEDINNPNENQDANNLIDENVNPNIDFMDDKEATQVEDSIITQKIDLKANLSFDRPLNNSSMMNFNLVFNSNEIEIIAKADIMIKDRVEIENPMKHVSLTSMDSEKLKTTLEVINNKVFEVLTKNLKTLKIIK